MVKENGIIEVKGNMFDLVCLYRELEGVMCKVIGFNGGTYVLESIEDGSIKKVNCGDSPRACFNFVFGCKSVPKMLTQKDFSILSISDKEIYNIEHQQCLRYIDQCITNNLRLAYTRCIDNHVGFDEEHFNELVYMIQDRRYKTVKDCNRLRDLCTHVLTTTKGVPSYLRIGQLLEILKDDHRASIYGVERNEYTWTKLALQINSKVIYFGIDVPFELV